MAFELQDGAGGSKKAKISDNNELYVLANNRSLQHHVSHEKGRAFQIFTVNAAIVNGQNNILLFKNLSQIYDIAITYLKTQHIGLTGGTAFPSINSYFLLKKNAIRSGGGESASSINTNFSSANISNISAYKNGFSLSDEGIEIDRSYLKENGEVLEHDKQGSVILGPNDSICISLITDHISGYAYAQISYIEIVQE